MTLNIIAQEIINVPHQKSNEVIWEGGEKKYHSNIWNNEVVTNVSVPTMKMFRPEGKPNGTSVIIAPGGGLYALSIDSEGEAVAKWLVKKGITAFVLKYRLVPTGKDGVQEITDAAQNNPSEIAVNVGKVMPLSIADGLAAVSYVREHSTELGLASDKIGFMGFSAGGSVAMGVAYNYTKDTRPDFLIPVYPWTTALPVQEAPEDAPPMAVVCASDDPLGLAAGSVALYSSWLKAGKKPELHLYSKGGHGFGMKGEGFPAAKWIEPIYEWLKAEELTLAQ